MEVRKEGVDTHPMKIYNENLSVTGLGSGED